MYFHYHTTVQILVVGWHSLYFRRSQKLKLTRIDVIYITQVYKYRFFNLVLFCNHTNVKPIIHLSYSFSMMMSSNGNIFCVTGHLCGEFTGTRWIPGTKASDAELWCFLWCCVWINDWVNNREAGDLRRYRTHYVVIVMSRTWYTAYKNLNEMPGCSPFMWYSARSCDVCLLDKHINIYRYIIYIYVCIYIYMNNSNHVFPHKWYSWLSDQNSTDKSSFYIDGFCILIRLL